MSSAFERTLRFVVTEAVKQPIPNQIQLFEDLAVICGNEAEAAEFRSLAQSLRESHAALEKVQLSLFSK